MAMHDEPGADRNAATEGALDAMSVAPPPDEANGGSVASERGIRDGHDAASSKALSRNPSDEDAKLDIGLDETFPSSDAPSNTQPGKGKDPAPSSGYDEAAEGEAAKAGQA